MGFYQKLGKVRDTWVTVISAHTALGFWKVGKTRKFFIPMRVSLHRG